MNQAPGCPQVATLYMQSQITGNRFGKVLKIGKIRVYNDRKYSK